MPHMRICTNNKRYYLTQHSLARHCSWPAANQSAAGEHAPRVADVRQAKNIIRRGQIE
jgi:hypothetical protein